MEDNDWRAEFPWLKKTTTQKHTTSSLRQNCSFWVTHHVGVEGRGELLCVQFFPVDGGEEHVVLDLSLEREQKEKSQVHVEARWR